MAQAGERDGERRLEPPVALTTATGVEAALAAARREVLVLAAACPARARRADLDNLRRGVRYRVVVPDDRTARAAAAALADAGADVRTTTGVPVDVLVVDGAVAVFPHGPGAGAAIVTLAAAVTTAAELFERVWATTAGGITTPAGTGLTRQDREVLVLLSTGCADESMAAQLGVSVRTVRRRVRAIMNRLGARSRFQAGVRAAWLGWLAPGTAGRAEEGPSPIRATAV